MRVLHAAAGDYRRLRELRLASLSQDPGAFVSTYGREVARPAEWWREWARRSGEGRTERTFLLAGDDDRRLGLTLVRIEAEHPGTAILYGMWVAPEARGRGAGRALCEACATWGTERGCAELTLSVVVGNEAGRRLYESCGFAEQGRTTWSGHGRTVDVVVMSRPLARADSQG